MQLDKIEAVVRPRTPWEAVDLGFCMVQRWAWDFYRIWFVLTLPVFFLVYGLAALFLENPEVWALIIIWWLKPLFDRIILHFFSHALFGEHITLRQMLNELPRLIFKTRLFLSLTLYRLSPVRSFTLPVWQLEGSRGAIAQQRFKVLQQNSRGTATWLTIVCLHFEGLIMFLLYALVFLSLPKNIVDLDAIYYFFSEQDNSTVLLWIDFIIKYVALSLIEPFYVTAGFALYLNRRTHLEGWDIELMFRQIRKKAEALQTTVVVSLMAVIISIVSLYSADLSAQIAEPELAKPYIEEVLQQPEFEIMKQQQYWEYIGDQLDPEYVESNEDWQLSFSWISFWANLFEIMLWMAVAGGIAWLIYKILNNPQIQQWLNQKQTDVYQPRVETAFMTQEKQTLPSDIAQQAWQLWEQEQHRQAVSLLYRGTLAQLQQEYEVVIHDSATENECVHLVRRTQSIDLSVYFSRLTHAWQTLAYGKRLPDSQEVQQLCEQWPQFFR